MSKIIDKLPSGSTSADGIWWDHHPTKGDIVDKVDELVDVINNLTKEIEIMKKKLDMTPICDKCGKVAPINEEMSSENWIVYDVKEPCECGGKFRARCLVEEGK